MIPPVARGAATASITAGPQPAIREQLASQASTTCPADYSNPCGQRHTGHPHIKTLLLLSLRPSAAETANPSKRSLDSLVDRLLACSVRSSLKSPYVGRGRLPACLVDWLPRFLVARPPASQPASMHRIVSEEYPREIVYIDRCTTWWASAQP